MMGTKPLSARKHSLAVIAMVMAMAFAIVSGDVALGADLGDTEKGAKLWGKCKSCHMVGVNARNRNGPLLNEVFGRAAASVEGFRYSKAMRRAGADGLIWTPDALDRYIENPKSLVTGTRMAFRGMSDETQRRDLLAFLRQYSANPRDIPESAPTASPRDPELDPAVLAIKGDPDYGAYLSSECVTCHQANGADKGIPSITGWLKDDFVVAMHAYKEKARPHPVMQLIAGRLSNEEIASLAVYFQELN